MEDNLVSGDDHFEELFVFQEQDVSSASDHRIQACLLNVKVDVKPVQHIEGDTTEHRINHLDVATSSLDIFGCLSAYLNPG